MLLSRGIPVLRMLNQLRPTNRFIINQVRNSHDWYYRVGGGPQPKWAEYSAEAIGTAFWWWVLWHLFTEYEHLTGEFDYPDASQWTDEELGIPPADE